MREAHSTIARTGISPAPTGSLPNAHRASGDLAELFQLATAVLQARGAETGHIQAFTEIHSLRLKSPRKVLIQLTRALASESSLPPLATFQAICQLLRHRLRHHPDVGWRELQGTLRGYSSFLLAEPSIALTKAGEHFLFEASARGFALAHLTPVMALVPRLERCGLLTTEALRSLLEVTLQNASKKRPADLPALLGRAITRESLVALASGPISPSACATLGQVIPSWVFQGTLQVMSELAQGGERHRSLAHTCARLVLEIAGTEESLGWPFEAARAHALGYWGESVLRTMQAITQLSYRAATEDSAHTALEHISAMVAAGVTAPVLLERLRSAERAVDLESWVAREAPFAEIERQATTATALPALTLLPPHTTPPKRELTPLLDQAFDFARGYNVLREELSAGLGSGLLPSRLSRFGHEVAALCIPMSSPARDRFPGAGVIIRGIAPEIFSPLEHGLVGDLGHAIHAVTQTFGSAPREIHRTTFIVTQHLFAIVGRDSPRYALDGKHCSYLITPDSPHNPDRHAGWLVPTELITSAILGPAEAGALPLSAPLHPQLLTPHRHGVVAFTSQAVAASLQPRTDVPELLTRYHHLAQLFRLRLSLWHKGQDLDSGRLPFFGARSISLLEECYRLHRLGSALGCAPHEFPQLAAAPTFQYRNPPPSPFMIDTARLVLSSEGVEYPLPRTSDGRGGAEFALWHRHVVPYLAHVGTDLRFCRKSNWLPSL